MLYEENKKPNESSNQNFPFLAPEALEKITGNLNKTLWLGLLAGFTGIIGYSLNLEKTGWKLMFLSILLVAASFISGFFLGFLFGIPKRNTDKESAYNLSTNLVDISDWLTKIIIGLGLVEIKRMPGYLESIGAYIQKATHGEDSIKIFSVCCIVYFSIFGLYYGYNYMRLFLSGQFKVADDNLLKLSEKGKELKQEKLSPDEIGEDTKTKIKEYNQLLKTTKTEENYTFDDWYFKGIEAYDKQDYIKVITYMENALKKDTKAKNAADAWLYIGLSYYNLKSYERAIEATNKIINDYKNYNYLYLAHLNNGAYYTSLLQYEKALQEFEMAINLNQNYADSWNGKGYTLLNFDRYEEALSALDKAISLDPSLARAWYNKAWLFAKTKDKDKMITNLRKAIELEPEFKNYAKTDSAFNDFRNDEDFKKLIA